MEVLSLLVYFSVIFLCRTSSEIPRNLSEGLIFCCPEIDVEIKMQNLSQLSATRPTTEPVPSTTGIYESRNVSTYVPPGIVPQDYHGIHSSITIRSRRPSERECLKNTQPSNGCTWYDDNGKAETLCRYFVISGTEATPGEFPYMAAIGFTLNNETLWSCGGTLISKKFVLTAAHCAYSRQTGSAPSIVRLGAHNIMDANETFYDSGVANTVIHPNYTLTRKYHDIAILELASPLRVFTNRIKPACLWQGSELDVQGRPTAVGWGSTTYPKYTMSNVLLKGLLDIIPKQTCRTAIRPTKRFPQLTDEQVCALDLSGIPERMVDTCQGDSGGPLMTNDSRDAGYEVPYIIGITSFGKTCANGSPGIYTKISSYVPWIESIVWPDMGLESLEDLFF